MPRESNKNLWILGVAIGLYLGLLLLSFPLVPLHLMPVPIVMLGIPTLFATLQPLAIQPHDSWTIWTRLGMYLSFYATAFVLAMIALVPTLWLCLWLLPVQENRPPIVGGAEWVIFFFHGQLTVVHSAMIAGAISMFALLASLLAMRRSGVAWILFVLHLPGTMLFGILIYTWSMMR